LNRIGLVALMLFLLVPGPVAAQLYSFGEQVIGAKPNAKLAAAKIESKACESIASVRALAALPNARIVAPFDIGPTILLVTPHHVLASSHHRNEAAMHDHIEIFRSVPDKAKAIIKKHGITHIVACPGEAEMRNYSRKAPLGLWHQLSQNKVPAWLEPLADMGDGIKVWRVR
jgi:hypothetical protein